MQPTVNPEKIFLVNAYQKSNFLGPLALRVLRAQSLELFASRSLTWSEVDFFAAKKTFQQKHDAFQATASQPARLSPCSHIKGFMVDRQHDLRVLSRGALARVAERRHPTDAI